MLGLNLNRPRSQWPKKGREPKKEACEILVPAETLDRYRKHVARCQWRAETSATLSGRLSGGFCVGRRTKKQRMVERKTAMIYKDVYERLVAKYPDETARQDFLDALFEFEARFWGG